MNLPLILTVYLQLEIFSNFLLMWGWFKKKKNYPYFVKESKCFHYIRFTFLCTQKHLKSYFGVHYAGKIAFNFFNFFVFFRFANLKLSQIMKVKVKQRKVPYIQFQNIRSSLSSQNNIIHVHTLCSAGPSISLDVSRVHSLQRGLTKSI